MLRSNRQRRNVLLAALLIIALVLIAVRPGMTQQQTGGTRQPIVSDQFNTTSGGALAERAPGLYTRNAIGVQQGNTDFFTGEVPVEPNFIKETIDLLLLTVIQTFTDLLNGLGSLFGFSGSTGNLLGGLLP